MRGKSIGKVREHAGAPYVALALITCSTMYIIIYICVQLILVLSLLNGGYIAVYSHVTT